MLLISRQPESTTLQLSQDELAMINNALNEVCNGVPIEDREFQTRLGFDRPTLLGLLAEIHDAIEGRNR